jgi:hypothetical protein
MVLKHVGASVAMAKANKNGITVRIKLVKIFGKIDYIKNHGVI